MKHNHLFILLLLFADIVVAEAMSLDIKEWQVPYEDSRPRDPYVAPDGRVWFCGQLGAYIAVLDPSLG
jgi:virginiamycin B lyase